MKKVFYIIFFTFFFYIEAFAEKEQYLSSDNNSLGVIELETTNEGITVIGFKNITKVVSPNASQMAYYIFIKFKNYSDAEKIYREGTQYIDSYDDFFETFKEIRDSEKVMSVSGKHFIEDRVAYHVVIVDYDAPIIKEDKSVSSENIDSDYEVVTIKELNSNEENFNNKHVSIFHVKLLGEDPKDSKGNIPAVVYEDKSNLIIVKISPNCISDFNKYKSHSINYYGTFIVESKYNSYILVDKITAN